MAKQHRSDCAMHNGPALPPAPCNCGADPGAFVPYHAAPTALDDAIVYQGEFFVADCGEGQEAQNRAALIAKLLNEHAAMSNQHPDDLAVDAFAAAMKAKLAEKRRQGYGGWNDPARCKVEMLAQCLADHLVKGDMVDIGNFAMMLFHRTGGGDAVAKQFRGRT